MGEEREMLKHREMIDQQWVLGRREGKGREETKIKLYENKHMCKSTEERGDLRRDP